MRLIFAGTPEPAAVALQKLIDSDHEVVAVLSRPDAPRGRGRTLHPSAVSALAQEHGIEVLTPVTLKVGTEDGEAFRQRLAELAPDCVPVVAYGNLIPEDILAQVPHGFVNLHFSLLPQWRGAAPVQAAIAAGDPETGATTFRIDKGLDTGEILKTFTYPLTGTETAGDLLAELAQQGGPLLLEPMDGLEAGTITPTPQQGAATYAGKISVADAKIDWNGAADQIDRAVRAVTPFPGAWTTMAEQRYKLGAVKPVGAEQELSLAPGEIHIEKKRVLVGTATEPVQLSTIQPPSKKMMNATDWARGLHEKEGLKFQ